MANPLANLTPRDRLILTWSLPVIALLAIVLLVRPLFSHQGQVAAEIETALEDIAWLQAQRGSLGQARPGCAKVVWSDQVIDRTAARYGIALAQQGGDDELQLAISSGQGNQVLAFLGDLECQGASVTSLSLETRDDQGAVQGRVTLRPPVI